MKTLNVAALGWSGNDQNAIADAVRRAGARLVVSTTDYNEGSGSVMLNRARPDVVLVLVPDEDPTAAVAAIGWVSSRFAETVTFAIGDMAKPHNIVAAMRAGAREFLEMSLEGPELKAALDRVVEQRCAARDRGKVVVVLNAKGGCGATIVAVNTAMALATRGKRVALVDLAPLGTTALHLNVKPEFTIIDAFRNLHRLDGALLDSYMISCGSNLSVLAGPDTPQPTPSPEEISALLDVVSTHYEYVVIDNSSRMDTALAATCKHADQVFVVCQPELVALWAANEICKHISSNGAGAKPQVVVNRYRKGGPLNREEIEGNVGVSVVWTFPNQYLPVARSIESGQPLAMQLNGSDLGKSFIGFAGYIAGEKVGQQAQPAPAPSRGLLDRFAGLRFASRTVGN